MKSTPQQQLSSVSAKKRLRGLQRLLNKQDLPEEVRRSKQVELENLQEEARKQNRTNRERHFRNILRVV